MKTPHECVKPVFFSQHCPQKFFIEYTRILTCATFQYQQIGEDPRANGWVVLEIWPTNDLEKKSWSGSDSNPGRGLFSTFLMNAWCNSEKWHIRRCAILFHIQWDSSGRNPDGRSCAIRRRLIAVLWLPRATCRFSGTINLIPYETAHDLPLCHNSGQTGEYLLR